MGVRQGVPLQIVTFPDEPRKEDAELTTSIGEEKKCCVARSPRKMDMGPYARPSDFLCPRIGVTGVMASCSLQHDVSNVNRTVIHMNKHTFALADGHQLSEHHSRTGAAAAGDCSDKVQLLTSFHNA